MSYYVGLDVSVKSVSICVVEAGWDVIARGEVSSDPDQIAAFLFRHAPDAERVVHESGILSIWLTREMEKRGLPIVCIDARLAHKALSGRLNKSDRGDAEGLAHLARTGWFTQVHIRSEASERIRVLIGTRERLIKMRKDLEGHVRGVLKVFGICMTGVHRAKMRQGFRDQLAKAGVADPAIGVMVDMFNPIHLALCSAADAMDVELCPVHHWPVIAKFAHSSISARRRSRISDRAYALSVSSPTKWASDASATSRAATLLSATQSRKVDRKPCAVNVSYPIRKNSALNTISDICRELF
jgi:hypothetical protein